MSISIIIPAYNEQKSIGKTLNKVTKLEGIDEILVINDGSTDNTYEIAVNISNVKVISHPYNLGNGAAIKTGIRNAKGDWVLMMDAEGQHPAEVVPELLEHLGQYEMIIGARNSTSNAKVHRTIANRVFNIYASYIVGYHVADLTSGFRLVRRETAMRFIHLLPNGYSYPTTLTIALFRAGFPIKYHPFKSPNRTTGKSGIRPIVDGLRFLLKITQLGAYFVPMKIFLPISLLFFVPGFLYTILQLIMRSQFSGFGGLMTTIGVLIFLLGLIAQQISTLYLVYTER